MDTLWYRLPRPADLLAAAALYSRHPTALGVAYADLEAHTRASPIVSVGTVGSIIERSNGTGFTFFAHAYYDASGKKRERYVAGPVGDGQADAAAAALRARIDDARAILPNIRLLGREGYNLADSRAYATLAALANHGLFAGGAMLVGSHAYGILLNELGVRAQPYATEDVDIARPSRITLSGESPTTLAAALATADIEFAPVPRLDPRQPSTSYKQRGRASFQVDLLVPARSDDYPIVRVPELDAHAIGLPHLAYLLADSHIAMVLAREGCCLTRIPQPERFALHKLLVSQLRGTRSAKIEKDLHEGCVLIAVLADLHSGAVAEAAHALSGKAVKILRKALPVIERRLAQTHPRGWDELTTALS